MKYLAIVDDDFLKNFRLDDNGLTLVVQDRVGAERGVRLKPLKANVFVKAADGQSAYLTRGHVDAMLDYESKMARSRLERILDETMELVVQNESQP